MKNKDQLYNEIVSSIIEHLKEDSVGDLGDIGNSVGIAIAAVLPKTPTECFEIEDFILGLNHGLSIINGTH